MGLITDVELPKLNLGGKDLVWVKKLKYLGVMLVSGKYLTVYKFQLKEILGASLIILQKCKVFPEEILCNLILTN